MENEIVKVEQTDTVPAINYNQETVDAVKHTIFKDATDAELLLFFHKCRTVGCHPLDKMIIPSKFNDGQGGKTVVFITTIDYFRSVAETTGLYDGQDEAVIEYDSDGNIVRATVNVYRKDISRPFVGVANWSEFYPDNEKKVFQWKKMPIVMISKCAEAQAFRKAFPQKLNKLYAEEEMDQAANTTVKTSTKTVLTQKTVAQIPDQNTSEPGLIENITVKEGFDKNQKPYKKYGVKIGGITYGTFSDSLGGIANDFRKNNIPVIFEYEKKGDFYNLKSLEPFIKKTTEPIENKNE
jgi:phage recombination protein Bet